MAERVAATLERGGALLCEAGTGTGKTLAYLTPLLLSTGRAIVSTATRQLQEQLYARDLPRLAAALGAGHRSALLKGRANYLCRQRLEAADAGPIDAHAAARIEAARVWLRVTRSGDLAELAGLEEASPVRRLITSSADNCLGQDCPHYEQCFVVRARRAAARADLVVVNHHLLLADLALKDEGFGELLPEVDAIVLDEAHQLPELAGTLLASSLSSAQLTELAGDSQRAARLEGATDMPELGERATALAMTVRALAEALAGLEAPGRVGWEVALEHRPIRAAVARLGEVLGRLGDALAEAAQRGPMLLSCQRRCVRAGAILEQLAGPPEGDRDEVRWVERRGRGFAWHCAPVEAGAALGARLSAASAALILTSATLAVEGSLAHFASRMGLEEAEQALYGSPFDFARQTRCYLPPGLPEPGHAGYREALIEAVVPVLEASAGRAFLLCTSHAAVREVAERLAARVGFVLLVQGTAPREVLLERFRALDRAVLLGTYSFWEGVDVRGPALSVVVIDKLPFAAPGDPLLEARCARIRERGGSPFRDCLLPQAVVALKQGVGRLIRDAEDRGVVVLCDPRLRTRSYGAVFLRSLPPMPLTEELGEIERFLADDRCRPVV